MKTFFSPIFAFIVSFFLLNLNAQTQEPPALRLESAVFYIDHPGGDLQIELSATHPPVKYGLDSRGAVTPSILATLYTPEDKIVKDFYWRDEKGELNKTFIYKVPRAEKGIWQFRITTSRGNNISYTLKTLPSTGIALMPARCWVWHKDSGNIDQSYFMVPSDNKAPLELNVSNCRVEIFDLSGKSVAAVDKGTKKIPLKAGEVYRLQLTTNSPNWNWSGYGGFPVIFCKTPEFAKKLKAGRIQLSDGMLVPLGFQKRVDEWKKTLKKEDLIVSPVDLAPLREKFLADPQSRNLLGTTGILSAAEFLLSIQNIDPASHGFGSAPHDIGPLAFLYVLDNPCNPYHKKKSLLNRVTLYYLNRFAKQRPLCENGTLYEISSNYAGADGMYMVPESVAFALLSKDLTPQMRELWGEALGYPARRFFTDRVSCENQSAHWPVKLHLYSEATGNPLFRQLAEDFIKDLADPQKNCFIRTGYLQEAYGPDATYQGLSTSLLAFYAYFSGDKNALELVDRIYTLMNHTVAPEPDGTVSGASGFSHRTMGGWYIKQYAGGTRLVADKLDSAACWHRSPEKEWSAREFDSLVSWTKNSAMEYYKKQPYVASSYSFASFAPLWHSFPSIPIKKDAKFPVLNSDNFDRSFGDEFYFARRKGYYAGAYTGKTSGKYGWWLNNPPLAGKWIERDGVMISQDRKIFSPLQGLQLFWTPKYGTVLVSMNWSLYTHWTARLEKKDTVDWISYPDTDSTFDSTEKKLTMIQKFRKTPLKLKRIAIFGENKLTVQLNAEGNSNGADLIEQLPYPVKPNTRVEFHIHGKWTEDPGENVMAVRWINRNNAEVILTFEYPITVRKGKVFSDQGVKIAVLDVVLGTTPLKFKYTVREKSGKENL